MLVMLCSIHVRSSKSNHSESNHHEEEFSFDDVEPKLDEADLSEVGAPHGLISSG